ncbi:AP-3 complex subunit sigma-2 isoform 1-T1 [Trichechus inunguis]
MFSNQRMAKLSCISTPRNALRLLGDCMVKHGRLERQAFVASSEFLPPDLLFRRARLPAGLGILGQEVGLGEKHGAGLGSWPGSICTCPPGVSRLRTAEAALLGARDPGCWGRVSRCRSPPRTDRKWCLEAEEAAFCEPLVLRERCTWKMIHAILVFNNHGKPRLVRFYQRFPEEIQQQIVRETFHLVLKRDDNICNFLEGGSLIGGSDYKLIYRHYATLYFVFCVDSSESELGILDLIQVFVETLDKCFENVCELDLIFHMDKVHYILQEVVMGGMVLETNMNEIVAQIEAQNRLEKSEGGLSAAPARAVSAVKNINLPEIPRNINIGDLNIKVPNLSQFV